MAAIAGACCSACMWPCSTGQLVSGDWVASSGCSVGPRHSSICYLLTTTGSSSMMFGWGTGDLIRVLNTNSWDGLLSELTRWGLVHADNCLYLEATITTSKGVLCLLGCPGCMYVVMYGIHWLKQSIMMVSVALTLMVLNCSSPAQG